MESMLLPYRRYADFSGRSSRREYWMFTLFFTVVATIALIVLAADGLAAKPIAGAPARPLLLLGFVALVLFILGSIIPMLALQVRRFHDQDKSGWFILLGFVPYIGGLITLVFMCIEGTRGPNRYGPDPRDPYSATVFD